MPEGGDGASELSQDGHLLSLPAIYRREDIDEQVFSMNYEQHIGTLSLMEVKSFLLLYEYDN